MRILIAVVLCLLAASPAMAKVPKQHGQHLGRWIGYGWSEGYHAYDNCPNCLRRAAKGPTWLKLDFPLHGPPLKPLPLPPAEPAVETLPVPLPTN
jgi:hypothetical protein